MRKIVLLCGLVLGLSLSAMAQEFPKAEVFGGYSYIRARVNAGTLGTQGFNLHGGIGSVSFNPSRTFGIVGEFGGYKITGLPSGSSASVITYLFGPKVAIRGHHERITPFAQVLFGGARISGTAAFGGTSASGSENKFAMSAGGGIDVKAGSHFSLRLGQVEYLLTKFTDGVNNRQNNFRYSAGIVIH